jgi:crossover junction endodeoxyribonuclease RuvC
VSLYIGIDPGIKGALAFFSAATKRLEAVEDMPTLTKDNGRNEVDAPKLAQIVRLWAAEARHRGQPVFALMEDVGAMCYVDATGQRRGQGAAASFAFGKSTGTVIGVLCGLEIHPISIRPAIWKGLLKLSSDKNESRARASALFPSLSHLFSRKKDDGRAEAALLAHFAWERFSANRP